MNIIADNILVHSWVVALLGIVECKPCGVMMTVPYETGAEAINAWNRRANDETR